MVAGYERYDCGGIRAGAQIRRVPQLRAIGGQSAGPREVKPAEWAPWSLLSVGAVVILYSLTLNRQG